MCVNAAFGFLCWIKLWYGIFSCKVYCLPDFWCRYPKLKLLWPSIPWKLLVRLGFFLVPANIHHSDVDPAIGTRFRKFCVCLFVCSVAFPGQWYHKVRLGLSQNWFCFDGRAIPGSCYGRMQPHSSGTKYHPIYDKLELSRFLLFYC